jgi:DNA-directed RNA polymerase subunit M/transcription elongation factor TFIIS
MPLPIIQHPIFEVYLKSLDKNVRFRPFLVKEEKILLIARESNDEDSIVKAIKQIITNCCLDDVNVDNLPLFDIEMFFVNLRMRSVGEKVTLNFECVKNMPNSEEICGLVNEYELELDKIKFEISDEHKTTIKFTDTIGIKMKYPILANVLQNINQDAVTDSVNLIAKHVDSIFDADQIYTRSDFNDNDLIEFLNNLSTDQINLILDFFATAPKVVLKETVQCKKCGNDHLIYAENLYDFFI